MQNCMERASSPVAYHESSRTTIVLACWQHPSVWRTVFRDTLPRKRCRKACMIGDWRGGRAAVFMLACGVTCDGGKKFNGTECYCFVAAVQTVFSRQR